ncbi:MAG: hypothetical protein WCX97_05335 [Candidatus Magasanikbacteria bacterium]
MRTRRLIKELSVFTVLGSIAGWLGWQTKPGWEILSWNIVIFCFGWFVAWLMDNHNFLHIMTADIIGMSKKWFSETLATVLKWLWRIHEEHRSGSPGTPVRVVPEGEYEAFAASLWFHADGRLIILRSKKWPYDSPVLYLTDIETERRLHEKSVALPNVDKMLLIYEKGGRCIAKIGKNGRIADLSWEPYHPIEEPRKKETELKE